MLRFVACFLVVACGTDQPRSPRPAPGPATGTTTIHQPERLTSVITGERDVLGRPVRVACVTCHSLRKPGELPATTAELDEFHQGLQFRHGTLACASCHVAGLVAPITEGTWTRIQEVRLQDPLLAGYTAEQYAAESITHPSVYLAPGFADLMPKDFGDRITYQQLADLIAYLATQDQPLP